MPAASSSVAERTRRRAAVVGLAGTALGTEERALFRERLPAGVILFARNCASRDQVRALVAELRAVLGDDDLPVLIDQEGGRVMRLRPPEWPARVPARAIGALAERDPAAGREAARLQARLIAADLAALGITVACAPVLDLGLPGRTAAIGDRAYSADPRVVAELGRAAVEGFAAGGVLPVIKHLPGHGRAAVDSHVALPVVDAPQELLAACDWLPFLACRDAPMAMTAHVLYPGLDPDQPATHSAPIIEAVIRGRIGFAGVLLSDDLSMGALGGSLGERAARARAAGCDLALHCNGDLAEAAAVLDAAGPLEGRAAARLARALATRRPPEPLGDVAAAEARLAGLLADREATPAGSA